MMRILIVTPAPPRSLKGNRITALRWAGLLRQAGYSVSIAENYNDQRCDALIALHARRSAAAIKRFHQQQPDDPLLLTLTGTDLYQDICRNKSAQRSLELASRLVLLQPDGVQYLPKHLRRKARVIFQSVPAPRAKPAPLKRVYEVTVIGHLRSVKDPFRAALAVRSLPASSRVRIVHIGAALSQGMAQRARAEMKRNHRYSWLGELSRGNTRQRLARSRLMILTSKLEGGANVVSEAIALSVPVVSTRISGSIGILGGEYPGYFEVEDTKGLAQMISRAEQDPEFYQSLKQHCDRLKELVDPVREQRSWRDLLDEFK